MTTWTLELQRPAGVLAQRVKRTDHRLALLVLARMIRSCRRDHGLVLVLKNGREITYAQMRGFEV